MSGKRAKTGQRKAQEEISDFYFSFELLKQYPQVRSFIVKQPLKRSLGDTFTDLLGGSRKGAYRV